MAKTAYRPVHEQINRPVPQQIYLTPPPVKRKIVKKAPVKRSMTAVLILLLIGVFIIPNSFKHVILPVYKSITFSDKTFIDYNFMLNKASITVANDYILGKRFLTGARIKKPQMHFIKETGEMRMLTARLKQLTAAYPQLEPAVYVWDYQTGKSVNIKADKTYSAASIIKIPVLLELFKSVELGQVSLRDKMTLEDSFRAEGSGEVQYGPNGKEYAIVDLARVMIQDSDNSATNMVMASIGGTVDVNRAIKHWGLKNTYIKSWLPDLDGENYTTAKDMSNILFNVDNPAFLSLNSREYVMEFMGNVKNNRLLNAGIPSNALLVHKTGDIGKMLGDAGIVYTPEGKKYIVTILVNRPHNSPQGKEFIVKASSVIYNSIAANEYQ